MTVTAYQEGEQQQETAQSNVALGDVSQVRPIPRITIQAFCETDAIRQTLDTTATDRRMARAHISVNMGGIAGAVEFYSTAPTPNLIMVESRQTGDALMQELGNLASVCDATTKVIVIGHFNDILMYRELMANGISEYLVAPVSMADVMSSISDIFASEESGPLGKVIAFIGAKGGAGSSTVCHNIAWTISNDYQNEVVLADLDLAFGTANMNLDQDPTQGIADAVFSPDRIDDILLDRLLAKCAEHLNLLAAPSTLERTYDFEAQAFSNILEVAQRGSPYVIIDIPNQWSGWTKEILAVVDEVVITAEPELANLRNAKNLVDTIIEIRPNDSKPWLVLNKVNTPKRPEISVTDFANALEIDPLAVLPFDPALFGTAANNGQMISEADPKSQINESFAGVAQVLSGKAELKMEKKSALGFLKGLKLKK
ncbi:MAG: CpaE family protein [Pseudomonadota bacterium]